MCEEMFKSLCDKLRIPHPGRRGWRDGRLPLLPAPVKDQLIGMDLTPLSCGHYSLPSALPQA